MECQVRNLELRAVGAVAGAGVPEELLLGTGFVGWFLASCIRQVELVGLFQVWK